MALKAQNKTSRSVSPSRASQFISILKIQNSVEDSSPQGTTTNKTILSSTAISKIQLDPEIKNLLSSALHCEVPYSQVLKELEGGTRQTVLNNLIFKITNSLLMVHDQKQDVQS